METTPVTAKPDHPWPELVALMLARLALLVGLLGVLALLLPSDSMAFYAFMALAYTVTIPFALWSRSRQRLTQFVPLQVVVDLLVVTGVVYFTGGIRSDLALLYPLVILSAGIVATPRHSIEITVLSTLSYVTLIVLIRQGVLVPYGRPVDYVGDASLAKTLALRVGIFAFFGLASAYVSQKCQFVDRKLSRFREMSEIIFRNVRAGLVLLDPDGRILLVNQRACALLSQDEKQLTGLSINELVVKGGVSLGEGSKPDASPCYFKRPDGSSFPFSYETSSLYLPAELMPGLLGRGMMQVYVMVFSDISRILEMQEQIERTERVRAAVALAGEIAHEIRNPLAAVSGFAQLMQELERKAALGNPQTVEAVRQEKIKAYSIIISESARLDQIMERFINYTEFGPEAMTVRLGSSRGDSIDSQKGA